jgi:hypothetical protein
VLENHAGTASPIHQLTIAQRTEVNPVNHHLTASRLFQPIKAADQRRFTRPATANDAENLAALNLQIDLFQRILSLAGIAFSLATNLHVDFPCRLGRR